MPLDIMWREDLSWFTHNSSVSPFVLFCMFMTSVTFYHWCSLLQSMDKPPRGKHSTKGLGKTVPLESEFVKWRDDVVVPCGKPVPASIRSSELMYNEYIVYNTSQVHKCSFYPIYPFALPVLRVHRGWAHWPFVKTCVCVCAIRWRCSSCWRCVSITRGNWETRQVELEGREAELGDASFGIISKPGMYLWVLALDPFW